MLSPGDLVVKDERSIRVAKIWSSDGRMPGGHVIGYVRMALVVSRLSANNAQGDVLVIDVSGILGYVWANDLRPA